MSGHGPDVESWRKASDAEDVEKCALGADHVADGDDREAGAERRTGADPKRSLNENALATRAGCGFRNRAARSKSKIQAASPDVTVNTGPWPQPLPDLVH